MHRNARESRFQNDSREISHKEKTVTGTKISGDMTTVEALGSGAQPTSAAGTTASTTTAASSALLDATSSSSLSAASRALLEKLRYNDSKRGAAGKWAEIKHGLFRVSAVGSGGGGAGGLVGAPQGVSSSSSAMLQRGHEDHKQVRLNVSEVGPRSGMIQCLLMY